MWAIVAAVAFLGIAYAVAAVLLLSLCLWGGEIEPDYDDV
jgi:hypothetical protein